MKKILRKILVVCLVGMLFLSSSQTLFAKSVFKDHTPSHLSFNKVKHFSSFTFIQNALAEELEEEKNDGDLFDETENSLYAHSPQPSLIQPSFSQLDFDFLKIKSHLFLQLYLAFHCLKIPCI